MIWDSGIARRFNLTIVEVYKILEMIRSLNKLLRGSFMFYCGVRYGGSARASTVNRVAMTGGATRRKKLYDRLVDLLMKFGLLISLRDI